MSMRFKKGFDFMEFDDILYSIHVRDLDPHEVLEDGMEADAVCRAVETINEFLTAAEDCNLIDSY